MKKVPERKCIGCQEVKPKKELVRIVKNKENEIFVDLTGKANGRGAYICPKTECLEKAVKSKRLSKSFESEISNDVYDKLREVILNNEK